MRLFAAIVCLALAAAVSVSIPAPVQAKDGQVRGRATVISGDTLIVQGQRMRLYGIDAPEKGQRCQWPNKEIDCGIISRAALLDLIAPVDITCRRRQATKDGTWIASCDAEGFDVSRNMIYTGWAVVPPGGPAGFSKVQKNAAARKRGLWKGTFQMPWVWLKAQ